MSLLLWVHLAVPTFVDRVRREERGDVPGWILIAIMSAGLVILIWTLAGPLLTQVFEDAINRVTNNF